jgi:signal transduction histidine kinase
MKGAQQQWKVFLALLIPLALFFAIAGTVFLFPHENVLHLVSFLAALVGSIIIQYIVFQKHILPHVVELQRFKQLALDQERGAQLLVRRDLELTRANEQLRKLDEVKSSFISVVAHQLRTPLSGIKWTLNLRLKGDLGPLAKEQQSFLFKAYESNDRMIGLVNDMLGADRIESGKVRYRFAPVSLPEVIGNALFELSPVARAKGVSIQLGKLPADFPLVRADEEQMRAVMQNLLENAIKYSRSGGTVAVTVLSGNKEVTVSVQDDGIGIPKGQQRDIFNRFFRARNAVQVETEGSGLGLFIVKSIVEKHGGRIWFESEEGKGVTFYFTVPVEKNTASAASADGL